MEETNLSQEGLAVNQPMLQGEGESSAQLNVAPEEDKDVEVNPNPAPSPQLPENLIDDSNDYQERSRISVYNKAPGAGAETQTMKMHESSDLSPDVEIGADAAPSTLLTEIMSVDQENTLSGILMPRSTCCFKQSVAKIMSWQKNEIDFSLIRMTKGDNVAIAVQLFRNLLSYMTDRKSSKR
ncbi:MAG: hypothetical protein MJ252_28675, partial [archaeon]|nr:hypothetical protein [archaeon]